MKTIFPVLLFSAVVFPLAAQSDSFQLNILNLQLLQAKTEAGKGMQFSFMIENTGTDTLPYELTDYCYIESVLSPDSLYDVDDLHIATFTYPILAPEETFTQYINILIPGNTPPGKYHVLVYMDFNGCYPGPGADPVLLDAGLEIAPFTGLPCRKVIANGVVDCTSYLPDGSFNIIAKEGNVYKSYSVDTTGMVSTNPDPVLPETFFEVIEQTAIVKKDGAGNVVYSKTIPPVLFSAYNQFKSVIEFDGGYVISAYLNPPYYPAPNAPNTADLGLTLIKTDAELNVQATKLWNTANESTPFLYALDNQHFAFGYGTNYSGLANGYLLIMDPAFTATYSNQVSHHESHDYLYGIGSPSLRKDACGGFSYYSSYHSNYAPFHVSYTDTDVWATYNGSGLTTQKSYSSGFSTEHSGDFLTTAFSGNAPDGGTLYASMEAFQPYSNPTLTATPLLLSHQNGAGTVFEKALTPQELYPFQELVQLGHRYYLLNQEQGKITLTSVDCDNNQPLIVGVAARAVEPAWRVFPNPAQEQCYISGIQGPCTVTLFDLLGHVIGQQELQPDAGGIAALSLRDVPPGAYVCSLVQNAHRKAIKLVVF